MTMEAPQETRGKEIEGYAFTFCKAAFLALLCGKYAVLVLSFAAVVLYVWAAVLGVREWRCWVKPPWVIVFFAVVTVVQFYVLFIRPGGWIL
jgi:hypothetical protein